MARTSNKTPKTIKASKKPARKLHHHERAAAARRPTPSHQHGPGCGHDHSESVVQPRDNTAPKSPSETAPLAQTGRSSSAAQVVERLKESGFRLTKLRKQLITLIAQARGPLSVGDLRTALLSAKLAPNKSTLYRELYFLMEQKVVTEVDFLDGMKRYEFIAHDGHHHHIICTKCKAAECVEVCFDTSALLADLAKHSDFLVQNHVLEFFGLCGRCK